MLPKDKSDETTSLLVDSEAVASLPCESGPSSSGSSSDDADDSDDEETVVYSVSRTRLVVILGSAYIATFIVSSDHTILSTLAGPISNSIATLSLLPYIGAIYYLMTASSVAITGRLSDVFGRGPVITVSMLLVALGTLMCGLAPERSEDGSIFWGASIFLAGRAITGMGVGGMLTVPQILNTELVPAHMRGVVYGIRSSISALAMFMGGFLGGLIHDTIGWRWAFLIQVPICLVVATVSWNAITVPPRVSKSGKSYLARIDFIGVLLIILWLVLFQAPLNAGGTLLPWSHPILIVSFALSALAGVVLFRREWRERNPIIPTRLLAKNRNILAASIISMIMVDLTIVIVYNIPLFFEVVGGDSPTNAGLRIMVLSFGSVISALGGGWILKLTDRYVAVTATALSMVLTGFVVWCLVPADLAVAAGPLALSWPNVGVFLIGLGMTTVHNSATLAGIDGIAPTYHAVVLATMQLLREIGATAGISSSSAVLANILRLRLRDQFGHRPGAEKDIENIIGSVLNGELPEGWKREEVVGAFADGFEGVWIVCAATTVIALAWTMFLRRRRPSGGI